MGNNGWKGNDKRGRGQAARGERKYKADLDKLFDHGEVPDRFKGVVAGLGTASSEDAARQKLIRAARSAEGQEFLTLIEDIHNNSSLPDDEDLLVRALTHPKEEIIRAVLEQLIDMDGRHPIRKRSIISIRLRTLRSTAEASDTHDLLDLLEERL